MNAAARRPMAVETEMPETDLFAGVVPERDRDALEREVRA